MTDIQQYFKWWLETEEVYFIKNASKGQINAFYKRFCRDVKYIIEVSGGLESSLKATKRCVEHFKKKKLNYNISTIAKNITRFMDPIPSCIDKAMLRQYCILRKQVKGEDISEENVIQMLKLEKEKSNIPFNQILEKKIIELKREYIPKTDVLSIVKKIADGKSIKEEAK